MHYKMGGEDFGELLFRDFILLLIDEIRSGRRHVYMRLLLYARVEDFIANDSKYFAIFVRKRDIYVVRVRDIDEPL